MAGAGTVVAFDVDRRNAGAGQPCGLRGGGRFLGSNWEKFNGGASALAGITIAHDNVKVGTGFGKRFQSFRKGTGAVLEFFAPQGDLLDFNWHGESSNE